MTKKSPPSDTPPEKCRHLTVWQRAFAFFKGRGFEQCHSGISPPSCQTHELDSFRSALELTPGPGWLKDAEHRYLLVNHHCEKLLGKARAEILGQTVFDLAPPDIAEASWLADAEARTQGHTVINQLSDPADSSRIYQTFRRPVHLPDGTTGILGMAFDISELKEAESGMMFRDQQLKLALQAARLCTWEWNLSNGRLLLGSNALDVMGYEALPQGNVAEHFNSQIHPDDRENLESALIAHVSGQSSRYECEFRFQGADEKWRWLYSVGQVISQTQAGIPERMLGVNMDISDRKDVEIQLRLTSSVYRNTQQGILITNSEGIIVDVNPAFSIITGYNHHEVIGQRPGLLGAGLHDREFFLNMWSHLRLDGRWEGELWNRHKNGTPYPIRLNISSISDEINRITHFIGVFYDISAEKERAQRLERTAYYDALTGIPNRLLFADRLQQAIAQARRTGRNVGLGYLDLDGFKPINDHFGHKAGDQVLIEVAQRLSSVIREGDTVARIGGDEFVLLLIDQESLNDFEHTGQRLIEAVSRPILIGESTVAVSASIGFTFFPTDESSPDVLMRHADQSMYLAKKSGKNRVQIYTPLSPEQEQASSRFESVERIRFALERGEFHLVYQPKINIVYGRLVGLEALIRWQHPERGCIYPGDFLPIIEDAGLSQALGEWVLESVLEQAQKWEGSTVNVPISLNLSGMHLRRKDIPERLIRIMRNHPDVPVEMIDLEISESAFLEAPDEQCTAMRQLQRLGFGLTLDHFGFNDNLFNLWRNVPAETIKLDQQLVGKMLHEHSTLTAVEAILALAAVYQRTVIAEGVETLEQASVLLGLGCEHFQGFWIAAPMEPTDIPAWISDAPWIGLNAQLNLPVQSLHTIIEHAKQDHLRWIQSLTEAVEFAGVKDTSPIIVNPAKCRFGRWYEAARNQPYAHHPRFHSIGALHDVIHLQGREILRCLESGHLEKARCTLNQIHELKDQLLAQMDDLETEESPKLASVPDIE